MKTIDETLQELDPCFNRLIEKVIDITDESMFPKRRFVVQAWGQAWLILDSQSQTVVPNTIGELDSRILIAEIMNLSWEEKCQTKVVPIR